MGGGANRALSGALLRPSQAGVREAFGELSSGTCATIALQTSPPPSRKDRYQEVHRVSSMGTGAPNAAND